MIHHISFDVTKKKKMILKEDNETEKKFEKREEKKHENVTNIIEYENGVGRKLLIHR